MPISPPNTVWPRPPAPPAAPPQKPAGLNPAQMAQINTPAQNPNAQVGVYPNPQIPVPGGPQAYIPWQQPGYGAPPTPPQSYGPAAPSRIDGPGGNWMDPVTRKTFDAWGNEIPHLGWGFNDKGQAETEASPDQSPYARLGAPPVAPGAGAAGAGLLAPPGQAPTYYSPTTGSPYLTLPQNWLSYVDPTVRAQLNQQLQGMGFQGTGSVGSYGEQMYLRPPAAQFDNNDLSSIMDPALRQWLRFFLGQLGYGQSYTLPDTPTGTGLPPAPPNPAA